MYGIYRICCGMLWDAVGGLDFWWLVFLGKGRCGTSLGRWPFFAVEFPKTWDIYHLCMDHGMKDVSLGLDFLT